MDILKHILKSDFIDSLNEAESGLDTTKALIVIQVKDNNAIDMRATGLNDYEVIGILESAKIQVIDNDDV